MARLRSHHVILACGWACFLLYAYPGFVSPDSLTQLADARAGTYANWHPPFMAFVWRYADMLWAGPFPMLVLQSVTFLGGAYVLFARYLAPARAAVLASLLLVFPPVLGPMAVIWKDCQMAGYLLAGTAALLSQRRGVRIAGCVLIFVATAVRHNALAATLPIVVVLFTWRPDWMRWRRYALAAAVWVAITGAAMLANRLLTTYQTYPWHNSVALLDIAGVVRFSRETDDAKLHALLEGTPLVPQHDLAKRVRMEYTPVSHFQLTHDEHRIFDLPGVAQLAGVERAWLRAVTTQPRAFLYHRWRVFREAIGAGRASVTGIWYDTVEEPGVIPSRTPVQYAWISALIPLAGTLFFRVWAYLVLALALLAMCRSRLPLALLASGLVIELSLLAAAPSPDYRYSHWMVVTTLIAGVMIFVERYRGVRFRRCPAGSVSPSGSSAPPVGSPGSR